ncbi:MAG TPA: glycogen debranching protein GlgX [Dissulfurispiraceae bacterium]|nr:glycogen debranching protein GlgX [Dissulfurispiraceae bacterium]
MEPKSRPRGSDALQGKSYPPGASFRPGGVNFSVYSRGSSVIELLLFDNVDDVKPSRVIPLDPKVHRTYHYWHVYVPGLRAGQIYAYRAHGPFEPQKGMRFDNQKVLLDPYGKAVVVPARYSRLAASQPGDNAAAAMKSVVVDPAPYDWEGDVPLNRPYASTVIYEMHVRGFTRHPNSGVAEEKRGTYAGLIEKIPYLQDLGVTAVELLPVFQFDEQDCPQGLVNYWGYSPVSFFAPHVAYSSRKDPLGPVDEFRDMVKALHRAGIEVILDVVFNHTAEGNHAGPTLCYRGLDNVAYYTLEKDRSLYANYTGCGNTLDASNSIVRRLIVDSLRYWVEEMHVDGFRFDLASILARDEHGNPLANPPVLWDIETDPSLAGTKLIAEAWDAAGLYQVGSFIGDSWKEWNGLFRDDVRGFLKGDAGKVSKIASRLLASPDIYGYEEQPAEQSVNFVTCHDGLTLNDLVSYDRKHNEANREDNRDGTNDNVSWNCGFEGPTNDPAIEHLRVRQIKNFFAMTMIALGTPMLMMGDEVRRSQHGNNNAYCQDNEISWFDWSLIGRHADIHRFVKRTIALRLKRDLSHLEEPLSLNQLLRQSKFWWHGVKLNQPDWGDQSRSLAVTAESFRGRYLSHIMLNAFWEPLEFQIPPVTETSQGGWRLMIDTYREAPEDIHDPAGAPAVNSPTYVVQPRSIVYLLARAG